MASVQRGRSTLSRRGFVAGGAGVVGLVALGRFTAPAIADAVPEQAETPLRPLDFTGVRLLDSPWKAQQDEITDYYMSVPNEDYLKGFRERAGQQNVPGEELGGWYSSADGTFHPFGQILSGLARLYAATGKGAVRTKVEQLVVGFADCIDPDTGFFFYRDAPGTAHYVYDKTLCGLLDAWLYCGVERARTAIDQITNWATDPNHLGRIREYRGGWEPEWYTLSENLYRAYLATGDVAFRDFAEVWEYRGYWDRFFRQEDFFQDPAGQPVSDYHAYSHVNTLSGLGAGFQTTGEAYYRTALSNAYDMVRESQCWATGGYGPFEHMLPDRAQLANSLAPFHNHFETQCGSWAAFKMSKYLVSITGDARYGDWAEQMLYNGIGATKAMSDDGRVQYYTAYSPRGGRKVNVGRWSCCTGTRPQAAADYTDQVFFTNDDRLLVNLFLPSRTEWESPAGTVVARVETEFPHSETVRLVVEQAPDSELTLGFRSPGWLAGDASTSLNGETVDSVVDEHGWIVVTRTWSAGDQLEVVLPMRLELSPVVDDQPAPAAVSYGPLVLAYAAERNPAKDLAPADLGAAMRREPGNELRWTVAGVAGATARPFYAYETGELYYMHLDPDAGLYIALGEQGEWGSLSFITGTDVEGNAATCQFEGTGVRWNYLRRPSAGIVRVEIDGEFVQDVDQYAEQDASTSTEFTELGAGEHVLRLVCTGRKNPASSDVGINILDIELI